MKSHWFVTSRNTWEAVERACQSVLRGASTSFASRSARLAGSWTWDAHTNHVDWDDAFRARFGFGRTTADVRNLARPRHVDDRERIRLGLRRFSNRRYLDNTTGSHTDGTVLWMQSLGRIATRTPSRGSRVLNST